MLCKKCGADTIITVSDVTNSRAFRMLSVFGGTKTQERLDECLIRGRGDGMIFCKDSFPAHTHYFCSTCENAWKIEDVRK